MTLSLDRATVFEHLAIYLSHQIRDGDVGFTGLTTGGPASLFATMIPAAAMALAQRTHAPNMTLLLAGWCHNPTIADVAATPRSEFPLDWQYLNGEAWKSGWPDNHSMHRGDVTIGFCSAAQIDRFGNLNTVLVGRSTQAPRRLIGPVLLAEHLAVFGREIVMMPRHTPREFVADVEYICAVGHLAHGESRSQLGLVGAGPVLVITPFAVFDFDGSERMRLRHTFAGSTVAEVCARTGFEVDISAVTDVPSPTTAELRLLREHVDPQGFLRSSEVIQ